MITKITTVLSVSVLVCTLSAWGQPPASDPETSLTLAPPIEHDLSGEVLVADMTAAEREAYLLDALENGLPEETLDDVYLIALSDGEMALPILESHLISGAEDDSVKSEEIYQIADFIAYAGNGEAVATLYRLAQHFESDFFSMRIRRLLHYAKGRANPYTLAYEALARDDPAMADEALDWVRESARDAKDFEQLAAAIKARSMDAGATTLTLEEDPIVNAIYGRDVPAELLQALGVETAEPKVQEDE